MNYLKYTYRIFAALILLVFTACEKVIELDVADDTGKLVIEGIIDNNTGAQQVRISRNVSFNQTNDYPAVTAALVTIADQTGKQYSLTESSPGVYSYSPLTGISGNKYTLTVQTGGEIYSASAAMPSLTPLDSITAKNSEFNSEEKEITVFYRDPAGIKNYYRFVMYANGGQVKSVFTANDEFTDGRSVNLVLRVMDSDLESGDTVTVEMQCIDEAVYTYWNTLSQQTSGGPGGGTAPANPPSNLSNGALGYFSAHTSQSKTIIVK